MMGTPEDVTAEKYFTPPTLTEALRMNLRMEPECDAEAQAIEDTLNTIKSTFNEWLRTVGLPHYHSFDRDGNAFNATESIQKLLIILVDEP